MVTGVLKADRFEIPYMVFGEGMRCLVCVNGMQQTMAAWRMVVRRLGARRQYRIVLFDFPQQGRARCSEERSSATVADQIAVLGTVIDAVSPSTPVALLGGSWGAVISAAYAALHPARVSRLVLGSFQARPNARLREVAQLGRELVEQDRMHEIAELFIREFGTHLPAERRRALQTQFGALGPEQFRQMYETAAMLTSADDLDGIADLGAIEAQTLIVNGAADPIVDAADPFTRQRIPSAELCVVPGVGHFLHYERAEVLDVYAEFLHRPFEADFQLPAAV